MLNITFISKWKLSRYEDVCPVHAERQPDFHSSADGLQLPDPVPFKRGGAILLAYSASPSSGCVSKSLGAAAEPSGNFLSRSRFWFQVFGKQHC